MHRISLSCHPERTSEWLDWLWATSLICMYVWTYSLFTSIRTPAWLHQSWASFQAVIWSVSHVDLLLVVVVRPNDFADMAFVDCLVWGDTLLPVIDDHPMVWPLRLVMGMCRLTIGCSRHPISILSLLWLDRMEVFYNLLQGSSNPLPSSWCLGEKILLMMLRR